MGDYEEARTKWMRESGRLVWLRRRNGSWWPGQILSIDQVPESIMSSRRSGTPVKLLGREDAIVEWFNVDTSKRIKDFRSGEFNECIEKAEACTDYLTKRPVNYARRGDAIRHALQLEPAQKSEDKLEQKMAGYFSPSVSDEQIGQKCIISLEDTNSRDTSEDFSRTKGVQEVGVGVASKRKRTLTPHAKEFWKQKGILLAEPAVKRHHPGFSLKHGSGASQKLQVGCQGHQVKAQSFCSEDLNNSGQSTSGAATAVILGTNSGTGSEPRDVDAASCPISKSSLGLYDPALNLFEVHVKANMGYKSQNVPYICLQSRSNGWSILGHPLDVEVLNDRFGDDIISGYMGRSDEGEHAGENDVDRRPHGKHSGSFRFTRPCPDPKKLRRVSSLLASDHTSPPQIIPRFKNLKKPSLHCVPLNLIRSRLNEALR